MRQNQKIRKYRDYRNPPNQLVDKEIVDKWSGIVKTYQQRYSGSWGSMLVSALNNRIKDIKVKPKRFSRDKLEEMLVEPEKNENNLRAASIYFYNTIAPVHKIIDLYADILTYRTYVKVIHAKNKTGLADEHRKVCDFLRQFQPKRILKNITLQTMIEGKTFWYLRTEKKKNICLQQLPSSYCKIISRNENGWEFAFDLTFFSKTGTSIKAYPLEFAEFMQEYLDYFTPEGRPLDITKEIPEEYIVSGDPVKGYRVWKRIDPDKSFVFSYDDSTAVIIPPLASVFLEASELNTYKILQQELLTIPLRQILTATVPIKDKNLSGAFDNDTAITGELYDLFQSLISKTLPKSVDFVAAPFTDFTLHNFKTDAVDNDLVNNALNNFYKQSAISGLINTSDKPILAQVKASQLIESSFSGRLYPQFEKMFHHILEFLSLKNIFEIKVTGNLFTDTEERDEIKAAIIRGQMDLLPEYYSFQGTYFDSVVETIDFVDSFNYTEKLKPMSMNMLNQENSVGRPRINENKIESDNTEISVSSERNTSESRNVQKTKIFTEGEEHEEKEDEH